MTNITRAVVEAALDSSSAFAWVPEGDKHDRRFVVTTDSVPLGRVVRVIGVGVTAYDFDGVQVGPVVGSYSKAGQALEAELRRRWAAGQADEITAQINAAAAEIGPC
jgi:hypothetical protein